MIGGMCHCGAVRWTFEGQPDHLTRCNCSICRRYAALWAYGTAANVVVTAAPEATLAYVYGDRMIAFHSCRTCGCTTHYLGLIDEDGGRRVVVNMRMSAPGDIADIPVWDFDGAESWTFLSKG